MRQYKLILVLKSSLKDADRKKVLAGIEGLLGKVKVKETELGQKPLAYPIKREVSGVFSKLEFEAETVSDSLEKSLNVNENVLRHLLIRN